MTKVLILGNGISRWQPSVLAVIDNWEGELWGCNRVYQEYGKKLTRLTGHCGVLADAQVWKEVNGAGFEIWCGHINGCNPGWHEFTCPRDYRKDSGTTLVAQALHEKRPEILCAGFDLGGLDVGSPGMDKQDKACWVDRWRRLWKGYPGLPGLRFLGHDHRPYINSAAPRKRYAEMYMHGQPHIKDPEYVETFEAFRRVMPS